MGIASSHFQTCRFLRRFSILLMGIVQRLFSTFADGWPGAGLLLLRLLAGAALIHSGIGGIGEGLSPLTVSLQVIGMATAVFLSVGMFTPVAGALAAATKVWIAIS